jgi:hypothetical protein
MLDHSCVQRHARSTSSSSVHTAAAAARASKREHVLSVSECELELKQ